MQTPERFQCFMVALCDNGLFRYGDRIIQAADLPVGAMWYAPLKTRKGPDGQALYVRVPGPHNWFIDGRCSNCPRPDDITHRCWIRHGTPPLITVDKKGDTCSAGAGSIDVPGWHGYLREGYLVHV